MRALAAAHVGDPRFFCCAPEALDWLSIEFDAALAVWVLQHCLDPQADIARIKARLAANAALFVVNNDFRVVPAVEESWMGDGIDVAALLDDSFAPAARAIVARDHAGEFGVERVLGSLAPTGQPVSAWVRRGGIRPNPHPPV
jgi:hypothetical protein